jgi:UDPglucose 6-dehydrogenase
LEEGLAVEFDVGVIGSKYVGLATGACLARLGCRVTCLDRDVQLIDDLQNGGMPIFEEGLQTLISDSVRKGMIRFAGMETLSKVVRSSDVVFVAVGTPQSVDGSADPSNVAAVARGIGEALSEGRDQPLVVVNKSTVPVGFSDYVSDLIREGAGDAEVNFRVVSNPEFLREGSAVQDTLYPDRIVLGAGEPDAIEFMRRLYRPIIERDFPEAVKLGYRAEVPVVTTDLASAEMIKYAANAFLATKISFINEISTICELTGADVEKVAAGIGMDERIGSRFLEAGIGWGGSCFPKDVNALRAIAREHGYDPTLLNATVTVNNHQREAVIQKLQSNLQTLRHKRVALLGLSFKPGTDDLREAPSLYLANSLHTQDAQVTAYDPAAGGKAAKLAPHLQISSSPYEALNDVHAAVIVTEWPEIVDLDLKKVAALMKEPRLVVDGRNALDPVTARASGLLYESFGRG